MKFRHSCMNEIRSWHSFKLGSVPFAMGMWSRSEHFPMHILFSTISGIRAILIDVSRKQRESQSL